MFTGIIEKTGAVESVTPTAKSISLTVRARGITRALKPGASMAVNGCCLTVVKLGARGRDRLIRFDLLQESWRLTNLRFARIGSLVNLECALRSFDELGGHFVTGHVDGLGRITKWERVDRDHVLDITAPPAVTRYLVSRGSVAVDGISLTVAGVKPDGFRVWIIPHTFTATALCERKVGDAVNLEADLIGKYVEKFVTSRRNR